MRRANQSDLIAVSQALDRLGTRSRMPRALKADLDGIRAWWSDNIAGYAIGPAVRDKAGKVTGQPSLRIYVHRKVHRSRVPKQHLIPKKIAFEHLQAEARVDVRELDGKPRFNLDLTAGDEIGHFTGEAGTVGLFVTRGDPGTFVLSCAHVLAPPGIAASGQAIESPVDNDSTRALNQVAELDDDDHFVHLRSSGTNPFDGALGRLEDGVNPSNQIPGVEQPLSLLTAMENLTEVEVVQFGQATGSLVEGTISSDQNCTIGFGLRGNTYKIANLVRYTIDNLPGDSGAAVVEKSSARVLGIHVGSEDGSTTAYFSPMPLIVDAFGIDSQLP